MWQGQGTNGRVWGHVAGDGCMSKGLGHMAGRMGHVAGSGGMWQGVGSCGRGGYVKIDL